MNDMNKYPPVAYIQSEYNQAGAPVIAVKRGESGFYPIFTPLTADELNAAANVTKAQAAAMHVGSMFGWHVPAADPDRYDSDGKLMKRQPTPSQQQQGKAPTVRGNVIYANHDADKIVAAYAVHDALVAALQGLTDAVSRAASLGTLADYPLAEPLKYMPAARAALAAAKGQA